MNTQKRMLSPLAVSLDTQRADYLPILRGPPDSVSMRSGLVVLSPGDSVGLHSTQDCEEVVIVLQGRGQVRFTDRDTLAISTHSVVYIPPQTSHNVVNTGDEMLRYVYVVAEARDATS